MKLRGLTTWPLGKRMSSPSRKPRSASSFSALGASWMRYMHGWPAASSVSAARLTYEQAQRVHDGSLDGTGEDDLPDIVRAAIAPLYGAFRALATAREARGTLDLDLVERQVVVDPSGAVTAIVPRPRLDSHRLIEEFMVLANVCAAEELERRHQP
ncbi:MAG: RNB domain-containing ribonuclease, partial [Alphaproteobacteria bacterium]|nr:RNB domain-containing ribonuclease [Alphaproteobacteria bacterium]